MYSLYSLHSLYPLYSPNTHTLLLPSALPGHECIFDEPFGNNGVVYYILTVGKTKPYKISSSSGVTPKMSSIKCDSADYGDPDHLLFNKHDGSTFNMTKNLKNSWASIDLGEGRSLIVNYYCLRHGKSTGHYRLQSWDFEGSNDGRKWTVLRVHKDEDSAWQVEGSNEVAAWGDDGFSVAAWQVEGVNQAYRHFRIRMTGPHGRDHNLCCAGIELWGRLLSSKPDAESEKRGKGDKKKPKKKKGKGKRSKKADSSSGGSSSSSSSSSSSGSDSD
jgi:hypothetical protein